MKKLAIPAILAATVLVAGMFAFMPVQKASTVHTTILGGIRDTKTVNLDPWGATDAVVLYDGLGNSKSANIEVVAHLPTGAVIQTSSTITSGVVTWTTATCGTTVDFGAGNVHCDVVTQALRVLFDGTNAPTGSDYITTTINGV